MNTKQWVIVGDANTGKSSLVSLLMGELPSNRSFLPSTKRQVYKDIYLLDDYVTDITEFPGNTPCKQVCEGVSEAVVGGLLYVMTIDQIKDLEPYKQILDFHSQGFNVALVVTYLEPLGAVAMAISRDEVVANLQKKGLTELSPFFIGLMDLATIQELKVHMATTQFQSLKVVMPQPVAPMVEEPFFVNDALKQTHYLSRLQQNFNQYLYDPFVGEQLNDLLKSSTKDSERTLTRVDQRLSEFQAVKTNLERQICDDLLGDKNEQVALLQKQLVRAGHLSNKQYVQAMQNQEYRMDNEIQALAKFDTSMDQTFMQGIRDQVYPMFKTMALLHRKKLRAMLLAAILYVMAFIGMLSLIAVPLFRLDKDYVSTILDIFTELAKQVDTLLIWGLWILFVGLGGLTVWTVGRIKSRKMDQMRLKLSQAFETTSHQHRESYLSHLKSDIMSIHERVSVYYRNKYQALLMGGQHEA